MIPLTPLSANGITPTQPSPLSPLGTGVDLSGQPPVVVLQVPNLEQIAASGQPVVVQPTAMLMTSPQNGVGGPSILGAQTAITPAVSGMTTPLNGSAALGAVQPAAGVPSQLSVPSPTAGATGGGLSATMNAMLGPVAGILNSVQQELQTVKQLKNTIGQGLMQQQMGGTPGIGANPNLALMGGTPNPLAGGGAQPALAGANPQQQQQIMQILQLAQAARQGNPQAQAVFAQNPQLAALAQQLLQQQQASPMAMGMAGQPSIDDTQLLMLALQGKQRRQAQQAAMSGNMMAQGALQGGSPAGPPGASGAPGRPTGTTPNSSASRSMMAGGSPSSAMAAGARPGGSMSSSLPTGGDSSSTT